MGEEEEEPNLDEYMAKIWKKYGFQGEGMTFVNTIE
jgi:hypothetical protein